MPSPQSNSRVPALDGLRGVAVLMVYVLHYGGGLSSSHLLVRGLGHITQAGWTGVVVFFALSGYLITGILWDGLDQPRLLRNFYVRRGLRILPLYYFALALTAFVSFAIGCQFEEVKALVLYAGFLQNLPGIAVVEQPYWIKLPIFHLWSLAVEEQFYLLWPALLLLSRRFPDPRKAALTLCMAMFTASWIFDLAVWGLPAMRPLAASHQLDTFVVTHAGALALGAGLALAQRGPEWAIVQRLALPTLLVAGAIFLGIGWHNGSFLLGSQAHYTVGLAVVSVAAAALLPLAMRPGVICNLLSISVLRWIGKISYGVYVYHILLRPIFDWIGAHLSNGDSGMLYQSVRFVVGLPITVLVAWVSYRYLEAPILDLKTYFQREKAAS